MKTKQRKKPLRSVGTFAVGLSVVLLLHAEIHHALHLEELLVLLVLSRRGWRWRRRTLHGIVHGMMLVMMLLVFHERVMVLLLQSLHLLFEHLQASGTTIRRRRRETSVARLAVRGETSMLLLLVGSLAILMVLRREFARLHLLHGFRLERDRGEFFVRRRRLGVFLARRSQSEHGARILAEHLSRQMRLITEEKFMVIGSQFRTTGDSRKVPDKGKKHKTMTVSAYEQSIRT